MAPHGGDIAGSLFQNYGIFAKGQAAPASLQAGSIFTELQCCDVFGALGSGFEHACHLTAKTMQLRFQRFQEERNETVFQLLFLLIDTPLSPLTRSGSGCNSASTVETRVLNLAVCSKELRFRVRHMDDPTDEQNDLERPRVSITMKPPFTISKVQLDDQQHKHIVDKLISVIETINAIWKRKSQSSYQYSVSSPSSGYAQDMDDDNIAWGPVSRKRK
ncbi:uncharacterized protein FOMMEDRAFT_155735 [Fomitiporia mediterranea MF3/22]|uniref:uncharacterized protein n=1 Tax=Fomitiporia mediterranea (strain MF3/22) TaxID=694068 RepID=UPI0004408AA2|nr:uncharacterized protein FOMMEDRAFT_155735 [Fomitiporia mediterranea MF3/22]EJD04581.1 hypothetical protein FOMMEDRAFT_155735 [Fomitiporia mediterranea MF3/22]